MMHNGIWVFPQDLVEPKLSPCPAVYSLVLDQEHIACINGVNVICLGHAYEEGILKHEYFGSQKVI